MFSDTSTPATATPLICPPDSRARLARRGGQGLGDIELLSVVLGSGTKNCPVLQLAARVLQTTGGLRALAFAEVADIAQVTGIGRAKAARVVAAVELGRRAVTQPLAHGPMLISAADVDRALRPRLASAEVEHFIALPLDARNRPLGERLIAKGGISACPVVPSDVFRPLLRSGASGVIFVHNHPSGSPQPSPEDVQLTRQLGEAGELLGIRVVDHVIIGQPGFFSFVDAGLLS